MFDQLADFLDGAPMGSRLPPTAVSELVRRWATMAPGMVDLTDEQKAQRARVARSLRSRERWEELIQTVSRAHRRDDAAGMKRGEVAWLKPNWRASSTTGRSSSSALIRTRSNGSGARSPTRRRWRYGSSRRRCGSPRPAARYRFHEDGFAGIIQAVEPPRLIRFGGSGHGGGPWPGDESYFQFELEPAEGGTRLRYLQHASPGVPDPDEPRPEYGSPGRPGALAGWHHAFEELAELLDGAPIGSRLPPTRLTEIARNWAEMGMSAEFTPEQKARILKGLRAREFHFELTDIYTGHVRATRPLAPASKDSSIA